MKYGCRAHDFGKQSAASLAQTLHTRGYDAAQLAIPRAIEGISSFEEIHEPCLVEIQKAFGDANVEISVLSCYMDLSASDEAARLAGVENVRLRLRDAKFLGARQVGSETACRALTPDERADGVPRMLDSILRIVEEAARIDAVFAVEPVGFHPLGRPEILQKLLDTVADPVHLKVIFDPVNLFGSDVVARQEEVWREWTQVIGRQLGAVHVKDACVTADGTLRQMPLGQGQMDYRFIAAWLHQAYPDIPLLRDEGILPSAADDLAFMRKL